MSSLSESIYWGFRASANVEADKRREKELKELEQRLCGNCKPLIIEILKKLHGQ